MGRRADQVFEVFSVVVVFATILLLGHYVLSGWLIP